MQFALSKMPIFITIPHPNSVLNFGKNKLEEGNGTEHVATTMLNFDFKRSSRKCSVLDRPFESGEEFFSALLDLDGNLERRDYAAESWQGAPEECVGWWKSKMPDLENGRVYWAPNRMLLTYFQHVVEKGPAFGDVAYVMAILLVQKRILQMIENDETTDPPTLIVHHRKTKTDYSLPVIEIPPQRMIEIQGELSEHLFTTNAPGGSEDDEVDE